MVPSMPSASSRGGLLRVLDLITGLAITFGGIVSLGILHAPGEVAAQLPDPWWYMATWIAAGMFVLALGEETKTELVVRFVHHDPI